MIYRDENATTALTPPLPPPSPPSNNYPQLLISNCGVFFLVIAVIIELLYGHWTDVCSLICCFFPLPHNTWTIKHKPH